MSTSHPQSQSQSQSGLVLELAEEFLDRYRKGQRPPLREYIERHPELAGEIREVFPAMAMMENIALADESLEGDATGDLPTRRPPLLEQLGDYRIVREVGRGGMGVVYEAEQVSLGRHVALKVLPPQMLKDAKTRRRFEREARAAAKLHHTNIVPVFGVGEQGETPYYVMQFIQGQGLDAVLEELKRLRAGADGAPAAAEISTVGRDATAADVARSLLTGRFEAQAETAAEGPEAVPTGSDSGHASSLSSSSLTLPGDQARGKARRRSYWQGVAGIGVQVADALAYAHAQGIVHRDIKPSNLLLDNRGIVWVTDFGLAKTDDQQNLTHTGDILGTLRYMPPEAFGGKVDSRGDVYALGLTLYEMLAFRPAFDEKERGRLVKQVTGEAPPPLRRLNSEVPRDLETIVQKAIEREPSHRYASASELADDLRRFVDDLPIRARRASVAERLARWGRRNPALAALSGAVALLALVVICGLWYGKESARRALKVQTALRSEADERARQAAAAEARARAEAGRADAQAGQARRAAAATEAANRSLTSAQDSLRRTLYAAQINLAQAAWDSGSAGRTLELLEATRPKPGEPDFRGFEWSYFRRQAHGERAVRKLPGLDDNQIGGATLSADGALAGSLEVPPGRNTPAQVVIQETATGRLLRQIPVPALTRSSGLTSYRNVASLAFSADGTRLAMASRTSSGGTGNDGPPLEAHAFVWSVADGRELFHDSWSTPLGTSFAVVALSRDGSRIALTSLFIDRSTSAFSGDLRVLDVADGRERIHRVSAFEGYYYPDISPDGRFVAALVYSRDEPAITATTRRLMVLEVASDRALTDVQDRVTESVRFRFSPDSGLLAVVGTTPGSDRNLASDLVLCDLQDGRTVVTEHLPGALGIFPTLAFSPDGRLLILASTSGPACEVRELPTGRLLHAPSLGSTGSPHLAVRPSEGLILAIDARGNVREWPSPAAQPASLDAGRILEGAGNVGLAAGGRELIALKVPRDPDQPAPFTVHDVATGQVLRQFARRLSGTLMTSIFRRRFAISTQGSRLALPLETADRRSIDHVEVWDFVSGRLLLSLDRDGLGGGRPSSDFPIQAIDAEGTRLALPISLVEPRPDGKDAVSRGVAASIVELPSGRLLRTIPAGRPGTGLDLALRPDGKLVALATSEAIASGERRTRIDLRDADSGQLVQTLRGSLSGSVALVFSPDGRRLAATPNYGSVGSRRSYPVEVWDLAAGAAPEPLHLDGHASFYPPQALAFSADGRRLATAASRMSILDCEVKLWDLASGRDLVTWASPGGRPVDLAFDPDGHRLRVLLSHLGTTDARVVLLDASPLAPEVDAIDLVDRLAADVPLNSELADRIKAEPGLDPAIRAAALEVVPLRSEDSDALRSRANTWLGLDAPDRTPELMRRALAYIEHARALVPDSDDRGLATLGEARYRNGRLAECLAPLRRFLTAQEQDNLPVERRNHRPLAFIAMAEAKLGHRAQAQAALDDYRTRRAQEFAGSKAKPPEDPLLAEAEGVLRAAFPQSSTIAPKVGD
jgi:serine/threonine protein kinase/WD40 repeat protein